MYNGDVYNLDEKLQPWVADLHEYLSPLKADANDPMLYATKIIFEAAHETYLSILQPTTTRSIQAVLYRTLIECYADTYAIFRHSDPLRQAKRYAKYADKLSKLFTGQATDYVQKRDAGVEGELRPFQIAKNYMTFWNGKNITDRIEAIDKSKHTLAYYEYFSLFAHMNPVRQLYLSPLDDPVIGKYYSYIMLSIMQTLVVGEVLPEKFFLSLNEIAADYSIHYTLHDTSPKIKSDSQSS